MVEMARQFYVKVCGVLIFCGTPTLKIHGISTPGPKLDSRRRLQTHTDCVLKYYFRDNSSNKRCTKVYKHKFILASTVHWPKLHSTRLNVQSSSSKCPESESPWKGRLQLGPKSGLWWTPTPTPHPCLQRDMQVKAKLRHT